jgi:ABC-type uncharacterized transport system permease subunit
MKAAQVLEAVFAIAMSLFAAAYILPPAFNAIANASFGVDVNPAVTTLFQVLLPIAAIIAILYWFIKSD